MKRQKFIGISLLLFSVTTAVFSRSELEEGIKIFYYDDTFNCVSGVVDEACEDIGIPDCVRPITDHFIVKQIFRNRQPNIDYPGRYFCVEPYRQPLR